MTHLTNPYWRRQARDRARAAWTTLVTFSLLVVTGNVFAQGGAGTGGTGGTGGGGGIPAMPLPSEAASDQNDVLNVMWGNGRFAIQMFLILLGAAIFAAVVVVVIRKFLEINERDGKLTEVIPVAGVGTMILMVSAVLLTIGWGVITNTTLTL